MVQQVAEFLADLAHREDTEGLKDDADSLLQTHFGTDNLHLEWKGDRGVQMGL